MTRILHFADAHIDIIKHGRRDPESGLPLRVLDFLKALDTIIDHAINEKIDLVLFAGDAYRDRTPAPTFQREWGQRIQRLSEAGIQTILLVGNHDLSPAQGRANALQEFSTLKVPNVRVVEKPEMLGPDDLGGLPVQVLAVPWVSRARLMAAVQDEDIEQDEAIENIETKLTEVIKRGITKADPELPLILMAHASVQGAKYGAERGVMLGSDLALPASLLRDPRLDYVALGHIHKAQDLNPDVKPPVIYPGSIERVDFGEAHDDKYFVTFELNGKQEERPDVGWHLLEGRVFIDEKLSLDSGEDFQQKVIDALPPKEEMKDAVLRFTLEYPSQYESLLDETAIRREAEDCFEFHFIRRPQYESRLRLAADQTISSLTPIELLEKYWLSVDTRPEEIEELKKLAASVIAAANSLE